MERALSVDKELRSGDVKKVLRCEGHYLVVYALPPVDVLVGM